MLKSLNYKVVSDEAPIQEKLTKLTPAAKLTHKIRFQLIRLFSKDKGTQTLYIYGVYLLLYAVIDGIIAFILPILTSDYISSLFIVGLILASSSVWDIVADFILGYLVKVNSYIKFALITVTLMAITVFGNIFFASAFFIFLSMIFWGFYVEAENFSEYKYVHLNSNTEEEGKLFGIVQQLKSIGWLLGPVIAGNTLLVSQKHTLNTTGLFVFIAFIALIALTILNKKHKFTQEPNKQLKRKMNIHQELKFWKKLTNKYLHVIIVLVAYGMFQGSITSFLPIMLEQSAHAKEYAGHIVALYSLGPMLLSILFGKYAKKDHRLTLIVTGMTITGTALLFIGQAHTTIYTALISFAMGTGVSMFVPAFQAEVEDICRKYPTNENEIIGETSAVWNVGFILGAVVLGWVSEVAKSYAISFGAIGLIVLVSLCYYLLEQEHTKA